MSFDLLVLAGLVYLVALVWAIMDIVRSDFKDGATKIVFVLIVLLLPVIGVAVYMFYKRKWIIFSVFLVSMVGLISTSMYITAALTYQMLNDTNEAPSRRANKDTISVNPMFAINKIIVTTKEGSSIGLSLAIELNDKDKAQVFTKDKQKIEQMAIAIASSKTMDEIKQGGYKKELTEKLENMYPSAIREVYILNSSK